MTTPSLPAPRFADLGGRRLAYDEVAPPDPRGTVLFLTGLGGKRLGWARQLPVFGRTYRALAIDHRDAGDSDPFEDAYAITDQADDAAAFLRAVGGAPAHVVGISMGGMVALNLAVRHPGLVRSLVLVATTAGGATHTPPTPEAQAVLRPDPTMEIGERAKQTYRIICAPGYFDTRPEDAELVAAGARHKPMGGASYARQYGAVLTHDVTAHLKDLRVPTLVVHGELDPLVPFPNGERLAREIPGARFVRYADTGHIPIMERDEDFNRDVLAFLHDHDGGAPRPEDA